jgi:hypothetical protein
MNAWTVPICIGLLVLTEKWGFLFSGVYALTARPLEVLNERKIIGTIVNENRF